MGRLDFERRRQELLNRKAAFHFEGISKKYELDALLERLNAMPIEIAQQELRADWAALYEKFTQTIERIDALSKDNSVIVSMIENFPNGLFNRVHLEKTIGDQQRVEAQYTARWWLKEFESYSVAVSDLEEKFDRLR